LNIAKRGEKTMTFQFTGTGTGNQFNLIMRMTEHVQYCLDTTYMYIGGST